MSTVRLADCHDTCLDVEGPNNHIANVNPVGCTTPQVWRVDCDSCSTNIKSNIKSKKEARDIAIKHVNMSVADYWFDQDRSI